MKWFKHYTNLRRDEKIINIMEKLGAHKGYFSFMVLLELCSERLKKDEIEFTFNKKFLCKELRVKAKELDNILSLFQEQTVFLIETKILEVKIIWPKMLEIRDNYTKDLEVSWKKLPYKNKEERIKNKEKEKKWEKKEKICPASQDPPPKIKNSISPKRLIEIWNENRGALPEVKLLTPTREKRARVLISKHDDEQFWKNLILSMSKNPFLTGDNDRGWRADFDFLLQSKSFAKLVEGCYGFAKEKSKWD